MKRVAPCIFWILSLLCLLAAVSWCLICIPDHRAISADPSASGIDYLGLGFFYALGFVFCGVPGLVFSVFCRRHSKSPALICFSWILTVFFALCLLAALCLWLFGPGHP